jgi:hypothetical protein
MRFRPTFAAALLGAGLLSFAAHAATRHFAAHLDGASEVPPKQSGGSGELTATLDTATRTLTYTLTYSGLSGDATAAHFHGPAAAGKNAGVEAPIKPATSPAKGSIKLTPSQVSQLESGLWYVNVHTQANPGGEIRGQIEAAK